LVFDCIKEIQQSDQTVYIPDMLMFKCFMVWRIKFICSVSLQIIVSGRYTYFIDLLLLLSILIHSFAQQKTIRSCKTWVANDDSDVPFTIKLVLKEIFYDDEVLSR
jgi:hypothetical protein